MKIKAAILAIAILAILFSGCTQQQGNELVDVDKNQQLNTQNDLQPPALPATDEGTDSGQPPELPNPGPEN